jgi:DNA-binding winged helix-turn-helix (wHTH) protein
MRTQKYWLNGCSFDVRSGELSNDETTRRLEPKAAAVLAALCDHEGEVVSRDALLDRGWGQGSGSDEALTQAIAQIRRALDELGESADLIETFSRRGYRLRPNPTVQAMGISASLKERSPAARWNIGFASAIAAAALLLAAIAIFPHELRHMVRHGLGLGQSQH